MKIVLEPLRGQLFITLGTGRVRIGGGMKTFQRKTRGYFKYFWEFSRMYEIFQVKESTAAMQSKGKVNQQKAH